MKQDYLTGRLNIFTLSELEGGLLRVKAMLKALASVNTVDKALSLHKEMARENLLNEFSDVTPGEGMFAAASVDKMTKFDITMGRTGSKESLSYQNLMDAENKMPDKDWLKLYSTFLNQYKSILSYSLERSKEKLASAISEARTEAEDISSRVRSGTLKSRVSGQVMRVYKLFNEQPTKYRLDSENAKARDSVDKQIAFLKRNGVTSDLHSIVLNGFNYGLRGNFRSAFTEDKGRFVIQSEAGIFAEAEAQLRSILHESVTKCDNNELLFMNALPISFINGNVFVGYAQAILRLAFEQNYARTNVFLPVVVDKEMMDNMGLRTKDTAQPVHLLVGQKGSLVRKNYYFLSDTTFTEKYPQQSQKLATEMARLSYERRQNENGAKICDSLTDNYSSPVEESKTNDIEDTLYRIGIESVYGVCNSAYFGFNDECLGKIANVNENQIAASYKSESLSGTVYDNAINSGAYVLQQMRAIAKSESWQVEKSVDLQGILEGEAVSRDFNGKSLQEGQDNEEEMPQDEIDNEIDY